MKCPSCGETLTENQRWHLADQLYCDNKYCSIQSVRFKVSVKRDDAEENPKVLDASETE